MRFRLALVAPIVKNAGAVACSVAAIVGLLRPLLVIWDLYRRCRQVGWDEDVQLGRAYKLDIRRFSVDGYTDAVELCRQLIVGEIGSSQARVVTESAPP